MSKPKKSKNTNLNSMPSPSEALNELADKGHHTMELQEWHDWLIGLQDELEIMIENTKQDLKR